MAAFYLLIFKSAFRPKINLYLFWKSC